MGFSKIFQDRKRTKSGQKGVKIAFRDPQKSQKTFSLIGKTNMEKTSAENLIKPVVYEDFWSPFRKKGPKSIKKHYVFH